MKKIVVLMAVAGLLMASLAATADAKKKKKPKPVATVLYLHGAYPFGEMDGAEWFVRAGSGQDPDSAVMRIDGTEPTGSAKSMFWHTGSAVPWNPECTGLPLGFPTWVGDLTGRIVGDVKVTLFASQAADGGIARIWADTPVFSCNDNYVAPAAETSFAAPASGSFEVIFPGLDLTAASTIMVEFVGAASGSGRVQYDSPDALSMIEFNCFPPPGATSCIP